MLKASATALNHTVWCRAPDGAKLPGLWLALVHPPPRVQGPALPREESLLPAMGRAVVPEPREQCWDQSIKEEGCWRGDSREQRGSRAVSAARGVIPMAVPTGRG